MCVRLEPSHLLLARARQHKPLACISAACSDLGVRDSKRMHENQRKPNMAAPGSRGREAYAMLPSMLSAAASFTKAVLSCTVEQHQTPSRTTPTCISKYLLWVVVDQLPVDETVDAMSDNLLTLFFHLVLFCSLNVSNLQTTAQRAHMRASYQQKTVAD